MRLIKKLDLYMLKMFLGLFVVTFLICIFILLMQFVWMHVSDLVGKGVGIMVLSEFFIYACASVVPLALPLAILLGSIITFGNLGEKFELTAMKAAGVSLFRIMRPLTICIAFICLGAFFFSNSVLPKSQVKLWALIFSLRQKSPELDIPQGEFYDGIPGHQVYVRHKDPSTGMLYGLMLYDYSQGFQDASVMAADSAKIFMSPDNTYLILRLYDGECFENLDRDQRKATHSGGSIPYRRESFQTKQILIDFSAEFTRYSEDILSDQHVSKNVIQLLSSIDSMQVMAQVRSKEQSRELVDTRYFGRERTGYREKDLDSYEPQREYNIDTLYAHLNPQQQHYAMTTACDKASAQRDQIQYNALMLDDFHNYIRKHEIELYRKFTLAFACLIFFFIGAPLGAIIRKGGLGAPVVISVVMFIIYYIIDNTGYKMAREGIWPCWEGMWLSSFVLLPIGIFLTYKAATDSALLNPEAWVIGLKRIWKYLKSKWIQLNKHWRTSAKVNSSL